MAISGWQNCPTHTVASVFELYDQLLPTRLYASRKMGTDPTGAVTCGLCDKAPESVPHVLAGCTALAQNKYLTRHNAALKTLFFEIVYDQGLIESVPPLYSPVKPKPVYEADSAQAFWDVLGGWSRDLDVTMKELVGSRSKRVLQNMQKAVFAGSLTVARTFKVAT